MSDSTLLLPAVLGDLDDRAVVVGADTSCEEVDRCFGEDPDLSAVVVRRPSGPPEVVTRRRLAMELAGQLGYGRALYATRPIAELPGGGDTLVLDAGVPLGTAGEAALARPRQQRYDDLAVCHPDGSVGIVSVARLFAELSRHHAHRAGHDPLTGLANRESWLRALETGLDGPGECAVIFVDLDDFKEVNDSLGHAVGDELLCDVAARLRASVRHSDSVARLGGDEFAVVQPESSREIARRTAERLQLALAAPRVVGRRPLEVTASVGIAVGGEGAGSAPELLRDADLAMYEAKRGGKNAIATFEAEDYAGPLARRGLRMALPGVVGRGELRLVYQPVVALARRQVVGFEALLRWDLPGRGTVAPLDFVPLAEETGEIAEIGRWVLREACRSAANWAAALPDTGAPLIGVNVSPRQLEDGDFAGHVELALAESGLPAHRLCLEVTESTLLQDGDTAVRTLNAVRALGVFVAVDDFGVGFSSLGRLHRLPIDGIKLDRSFATALAEGSRGLGLVRGLLALARSLDIEPLAEGIEDERQLEVLRGLGCRLGQGYLFSRPLDAGAVGALCDAWLLAAASGVAAGSDADGVADLEHAGVGQPPEPFDEHAD